MGLDIYLYHYEDYERTRQIEEEADKRTEAIWNKYQNGRKYAELTEEEKEMAHKECIEMRKELGYDLINYSPPGEKKIEINSSLYPDHLFKIGYFRSSYNDTGIDQVLYNTIGKRLSYIFPHEDCCFRPDWAESKKLLTQVINEFKAYIAKSGNINVFNVSTALLRELFRIRSERDALQVYLEQKEKYNGHSYSNANGYFFLTNEPLKVRALVFGMDILSETSPAIYVIHEIDSQSMEWYLHALEIVGETIDWVMMQPDIEKYYLHWSS